MLPGLGCLNTSEGGVALRRECDAAWKPAGNSAKDRKEWKLKREQDFT